MAQKCIRHNYLSIPVNLNYYFLRILRYKQEYSMTTHFKQKVVFYKDNTEQESAFTKFDIGINSGLRYQFII